jgi:hypothetical protein
VPDACPWHCVSHRRPCRLAAHGTSHWPQVRLADGSELSASVAVVSNAPVWATARLLPSSHSAGAALDGSCLDAQAPPTPSFMHLHVGFRADGLPDDLGMHHITVRDWNAPITAEDNCVFVAVPSVLDPDAGLVAATQPRVVPHHQCRTSSE